eukprot:gene49845-10437_t
MDLDLGVERRAQAVKEGRPDKPNRIVLGVGAADGSVGLPQPAALWWLLIRSSVSVRRGTGVVSPA